MTPWYILQIFRNDILFSEMTSYFKEICHFYAQGEKNNANVLYIPKFVRDYAMR